MAKFYIATRLCRQEEHNIVRDALKAKGHELTYDWTEHGSVKRISTERLHEVALKELQAVLDADIVVVLLPGGRGTHVELGAALAAGKTVLLHSQKPQQHFTACDETCAFYHHPQVILLHEMNHIVSIFEEEVEKKTCQNISSIA